MKTIKIGCSSIFVPNEIGEVARETPKTIVVRIVKKTFESKTSGTGITHKFSKEDVEWFSSKRPTERRFWKETGLEVGGSSFIIK